MKKLQKIVLASIFLGLLSACSSTEGKKYKEKVDTFEKLYCPIKINEDTLQHDALFSKQVEEYNNLYNEIKMSYKNLTAFELLSLDSSYNFQERHYQSMYSLESGEYENKIIRCSTLSKIEISEAHKKIQNQKDRENYLKQVEEERQKEVEKLQALYELIKKIAKKDEDKLKNKGFTNFRHIEIIYNTLTNGENYKNIIFVTNYTILTYKAYFEDQNSLSYLHNLKEDVNIEKINKTPVNIKELATLFKDDSIPTKGRYLAFHQRRGDYLIYEVSYYNSFKTEYVAIKKDPNLIIPNSTLDGKYYKVVGTMYFYNKDILILEEVKI
jgi:hypothetical protein